MSKNINRSWTLNAHPVGVPQLSDFRMIEQSIPEPLSREILVEVHYHSLDPYMRGRMNPPNRTAYTKGISLRGVMEADAVGKVVLSNSEMFDVGDYVMGKIGWQEYGILDECRKMFGPVQGNVKQWKRYIRVDCRSENLLLVRSRDLSCSIRGRIIHLLIKIIMYVLVWRIHIVLMMVKVVIFVQLFFLSREIKIYI